MLVPLATTNPSKEHHAGGLQLHFLELPTANREVEYSRGNVFLQLHQVAGGDSSVSLI